MLPFCESSESGHQAFSAISNSGFACRLLDGSNLGRFAERLLQAHGSWRNLPFRRTHVPRKAGVPSHELTILSYHLKKNLWLDEEHHMVMLDDSISADLDVAMLVRRENILGSPTPEGILTRFRASALGRMVQAIETLPDPATIDLGFMLLTLGEDTVLEVSAVIEQLAKQSATDGKNHDVTAALGSGSTGLTIHCNDDPLEAAGPALERHCLARKYTQHAQSWYGVCIRPSDQALRFGLNLDFAGNRMTPWTLSRRIWSSQTSCPGF